MMIVSHRMHASKVQMFYKHSVNVEVDVMWMQYQYISFTYKHSFEEIK